MTSILSVIERINATNSDTFIWETKYFFSFFSAFLKSTLNFEHFKKKITLIADVFPKVRTPEKVIR